MFEAVCLLLWYATRVVSLTSCGPVQRAWALSDYRDTAEVKCKKRNRKADGGKKGNAERRDKTNLKKKNNIARRNLRAV